MSRRLYRVPPLAVGDKTRCGGVRTKSLPKRHRSTSAEPIDWKRPTLAEQDIQSTKQRKLYKEAVTKQTESQRYAETKRPTTQMYGLVKPPSLKQRRAPKAQDFFLPVVRYPGLYYSGHEKQDEKAKQKYCGTFYFVEPRSTTLLNLGKTLVASSKVHAMYTLVHRLQQTHTETQVYDMSQEARHRHDARLQLFLEAALTLYKAVGSEFPEQPIDNVLMSSLLRMQKAKQLTDTPRTIYVYNTTLKQWAPASIVGFDTDEKGRELVVVQYLDTQRKESIRVNHQFFNLMVRVWDPVAYILFEQLQDRLPRLNRDTRWETKNERPLIEWTLWYELVVPFFMTVLTNQMHSQEIPSIYPATALYPCQINKKQKQELAVDETWSVEMGAMDFLDQPLCTLARRLGFHTLVLQREQGEYRTVTEILDTRLDSLSHLVRAALPHTTEFKVPIVTEKKTQVAHPLTPPPSTTDWESYTVVQLRQMAHRARLTGYQRLRKAKLIQLLANSQTPKPKAPGQPQATQAPTPTLASAARVESKGNTLPWYSPQIPDCPTVWFPSDGFFSPVTAHFTGASKGHQKRPPVFKATASGLAHAWNRVAVPNKLIASFPYSPT